MQYDADRHWVSGNLAVSEWLVTGTAVGGAQARVRGCDHRELRDEKIVRKDSYRKIVDA